MTTSKKICWYPRKNSAERAHDALRAGNFGIIKTGILQFIRFHSILPDPLCLLFVCSANTETNGSFGAKICGSALSGACLYGAGGKGFGSALGIGVYRRRHATTLSADQMTQLLETIHAHFDLSTCREFTVEAGRPDTITLEKLEAIQRYGVTRISINPQTLNDDILRIIGRNHTTEQTLEAFSMAREHGFSNINMDLIAGLPEDTFDSFRSTMDRVLELSPESVTVHTLSLKRSSHINQSGRMQFVNDADLAGRMLDYSQQMLTGEGYLPYYLYRQSRMVGNLENTGWSKPGYESFYNVYIMDETHTIFACGAGAFQK